MASQTTKSRLPPVDVHELWWRHSWTWVVQILHAPPSPPDDFGQCFEHWSQGLNATAFANTAFYHYRFLGLLPEKLCEVQKPCFVPLMWKYYCRVMLRKKMALLTRQRALIEEKKMTLPNGRRKEKKEVLKKIGKR